MEIKDKAILAQRASKIMASLDSQRRNDALDRICGALIERKDEILKANNLDMERSKEENLSEPLLKRLRFDEGKIDEAVEGIKSLIKLGDPLGKILMARMLDDDLDLYKVSCPIGVIGVIFESRPDALVQISSLCLKSGNCVILKGGSEAMETNRILYEIIQGAAEGADLPPGWISLLETRQDVRQMLCLDEYIDLIIPRGSNDFVKYIMDNSNIPVLGHADGICHVYVHGEGDIDMALKVCTDAKTQYVAVCNAMETLLVDSACADEFLPRFKGIMDEKGVEITGCEKTRRIIEVENHDDLDWHREYLDLRLGIKVVSDMDEAIDHINTYGSGHTDAIITQNKDVGEAFMNLVDSANVFVNCSTRFSDGFRYGFGAEVGISTNKIHARGPVGLEGLMIYKYKLVGNGHVVSDYAQGKRKFKHIDFKG